jgi:hypothetical protein
LYAAGVTEVLLAKLDKQARSAACGSESLCHSQKEREEFISSLSFG